MSDAPGGGPTGSEQAGRRLPLFPLDNVVLMPGVVLPLHVFEPRYRQLSTDVLAGERRIGMIAVRPEHSHEMGGDPPLYEVGCAGFVTEHRRLPDGRFHLLLQGTERFRVLREIPREGDRLYRLAEIEPLEDEPGDVARAGSLRDRAIELLLRLTERTLPEDQALDAERLRALELAQFANVISQSVNLPAPEKQSLLEAATTSERLERLVGALDFHLAWLAQTPDPAAGGGSERVH
ncbi:MAG: LON peptidase substrate-binding domain-containing protein [Myxococcota bacterium]